ncbi:hypothetical protein [Shewanella donghaensis]|uniref:hypothetical protein n=1 Tax=Shewanella donghaensis TaxID=238836 RepID=UPI001183FA48|nr:hypothetical protein [Shewanella donghaensis]
MDDARCLQLERLVTNEELYILENVKALDFVCDECAIELIPCSFKKAVNLRRPYFKTKPKTEHEAYCYAKATSKIKEQGKTARITGDEGFPLAYPNRFNLAAVKSLKVGATSADNGSAANGDNSVLVTSSNKPKSKKSNYVTSSFQSIVDQFFNFPYDRDRELLFEGVEGKQYRQIFQKVINPIGKQKFRFQTETEQNKVFYSTLAWDKPQIEDDKIIIKLSAGWWQKVDDKSKNLRPYFIEANTSGWTAVVKENFINRLSQILELVKGSNKKALIAFVGKQDQQQDFYRFYVNESKLICFKVI